MKTLPHEQVLVFGNMQAAVFYKTPEWRRLRYFALKTKGNRCQVCGATNDQASLHVDHVQPRFLYPDRCLDIHNLQILCEDCHIAKSADDYDTFRLDCTQLKSPVMADIFRIERQHLVLENRPPSGGIEVDRLSHGVRCLTHNHRKRWGLLVKFLFSYQFLYRQVYDLSVRDFSQMRVCHRRYRKIFEGKPLSDPLFDIDGFPFPANLSDLLADDQRFEKCS